MNKIFRAYQGLTDESLVIRIQQQDGDAFSILYERYYRKMHLSAYYLLRDEDDAKDAVQELFSQVWQYPDRIDPQGNIKGYLYIVLRNRILTAIARSKHLDEYINSFLSFDQQRGCYTEDTVLAKDFEQILDEKIDELPLKMREVYKLSWHDQLSNKEISEKMSITEGTVKQHKHQALRILRGKLQRLVSILIF